VLDQPRPAHTAGAMLVRRSSFERVGPFTPGLRVAEGLDWLLRAHELGSGKRRSTSTCSGVARMARTTRSPSANQCMNFHERRRRRSIAAAGAATETVSATGRRRQPPVIGAPRVRRRMPARESASCRGADQTDARVAGRKRTDDRGGIVVRLVVDHDQLPVPITLGLNRRHRVSHIWRAVTRWHDDRNQWLDRNRESLTHSVASGFRARTSRRLRSKHCRYRRGKNRRAGSWPLSSVLPRAPA